MPDFPIHVEFELTNVCNCKCIMCPYPVMKRKKGFMDKDMFKKVVKECEGKVKTSYLHQIGEPLMHPYLIEMINCASNAGIRTSLSTNCILLDKNMTEKILGSKLDEIILCLDSLRKSSYEKIRGGNADYDKVLSNIRYFLKKKFKAASNIRAIVQMIKMRENKKEWKQFRQYWDDKPGVDHIWLKEYSTFAGVVTKEENVLSRIPACSKLSSHMTIQWNGDVVVCCRDYEGLSVIDNVKDQTITEIWSSEKYKWWRNNFQNSELCRRC